MGLRDWWEAATLRGALNRRQESTLSPELIVSQVPEIAGMSDVEGMAYTLREIENWRPTATPEQWQEIQRRQSESIASFEAEGLVMPYWGNLWLLRRYQHELGLDVPWVAPSGDMGS